MKLERVCFSKQQKNDMVHNENGENMGHNEVVGFKVGLSVWGE